MIGIYKITNPAGEIYIGQSKNLQRRFSEYSFHNSSAKIGRSLYRYGKENHVFNVLHELPKDITQDVLDNYECLYIDAHKDAGFNLLNVRGGGIKGAIHAKETRQIISDKSIGRSITDEHKKKISMSLTGIPKTDEHKRNLSKNKIINGCYQSIRIINIATGERYKTILEAATKHAISRKKLSLMLSNKIVNTTNLRHDL